MLNGKIRDHESRREGKIEKRKNARKESGRER